MPIESFTWQTLSRGWLRKRKIILHNINTNSSAVWDVAGELPLRVRWLSQTKRKACVKSARHWGYTGTKIQFLSLFQPLQWSREGLLAYCLNLLLSILQSEFFHIVAFTLFPVQKLINQLIVNLAAFVTRWIKQSVSHLFVCVSNLVRQLASVCRVSSVLEPQTPYCLDAH